ncbi:hypothetical protein R3P38DRAFT_3341270 [Favolaschia claudopus]|uniref:Uncharacterized protein n=1 Tax=Favolaschia claudopus TaxID=2862362 RepID=A0AAW0E765_9AGAR
MGRRRVRVDTELWFVRVEMGRSAADSLSRADAQGSALGWESDGEGNGGTQFPVRKAIQLIEAPLEAQKFVGNIPSFIQDNCKALGLPVSGNAAGHEDPADLSGLKTGPFPQNNGWHSKGIGAMAGCVLTAVLGMLTVVWYALGGHITEEEQEKEVRAQLAAKEERGRFFGLFKRK